MESANVVRARLAIASLGDLRPHGRYPERLGQFTNHRIPQRVFADEAGRRAYTDALARATLEVASSSREPCQS